MPELPARLNCIGESTDLLVVDWNVISSLYVGAAERPRLSEAVVHVPWGLLGNAYKADGVASPVIRRSDGSDVSLVAPEAEKLCCNERPVLTVAAAGGDELIRTKGGFILHIGIVTAEPSLKCADFSP